MKDVNATHERVRPLSYILPVAAALVAAAAVFLSLWFFDNRYTVRGTQPIGGILYVEDGEADGLRTLIRDWAYYPDELLSPADLTGDAQPLPEQYVFIGQYSGLDAGNTRRAPYGQASYRLVLMLPEEPRAYALLMPDIYSAYRLYVGGELLLSVGEPEGNAYRDEIGPRVVAFEAGGRTELLVSVASHGYLYNGMTHPPLFGSAQAVQRHHAAMLLLHGAACAVILLLLTMFLYVGIRARYPRSALFSALCLCVLIYSIAPIARVLWGTGVQPLSALYLFGYYAVFWLVLLLQVSMYGFSKTIRRCATVAGLAMCVLAVVLSVVPRLPVAALRAFSWLSELYKWGMVAAMLAGALYALRRRLRFSAPLLWVAAFYAFSLAFDRLLPQFDPMLTGWFAEVAGFIVLCVLGWVLWQDMADAMQRSAALRESLRDSEKRLLMQRQHYAQLDRQLDSVRALHHDFRQQVIAVRDYVGRSDLDGLRRFVEEYRGSAAVLDERIQYTGHHTVNIVTRYYAGLCREQGIALEAQYDLPSDLPLPDADLNVVFGNVLENAWEACMRMDAAEGRFIRISARARDGRLVIHAENSCEGPLQGRSPFASRKGGGQGMRSIRAVAEAYGGAALFEQHGGVFTVSAVVPLPGKQERWGVSQKHLNVV